MFEGAIQRRRGWYELALFLAWHVATFTRLASLRRSKLPEWGTIADRFRAAFEETPTTPATPSGKPPTRKQSAEEMKAAFAAAASAVSQKPRPPKGRS